jgi:acyl-CoA dehydrogenase
MSEARTLLADTAERLFAKLAERESAPFVERWASIEETGFPGLLVPDDQGGFGGDWGDLFVVARLGGQHALALPVVEAALAAWLAANEGLAAAEGMETLAPASAGTIDGDRFTGEARAVPWGRDATSILLQHHGRLLRLRVADATVKTGENPAGEPRDTLFFEQAASDAVDYPHDPFACGAFVRASQIAGALDAALALAIGHANERTQFGRPIAKFQTVQQNLAVLAEEAAAANSAGQAAARAADTGDATLEFAAAKLRANIAAGTGAAIAHQIHGAIGFTLEYPLHRLTRRITAWRSEFGGDRYWAERLGRMAAGFGGDGLWCELARRSDREIQGDADA